MDWILLVEGPKDAGTGIDLGFLATTAPSGASGMRRDHADELRGHRVAVLGDHDAAGEAGARHRARLLAGVAQEVRILPPLGGEPGSGFDLTDWVDQERHRGARDAEIAAALRRLLDVAPPPASSDDLPRIEVSTREKDVADAALSAVLARERNLFQRGGALVHVVRAEKVDRPELLRRPVGSPIIRSIAEPRMREMLAEHCRFVASRARGDGEPEPAHPPRWAARALLARGDWPGVPRLEAVVECPILRADGSILQRPGYDPDSRVLYAPNADYEPVPERPAAADVHSALDLLREMVCDFPFKSTAHGAAWLASLLTPLARFAFWGPSPLGMIDANVRGAGKSLLADVCNAVCTGRPAARMSYHRNEEELRKAITSVALSGAQIVLIDNITGRFGDATLDRALTATTWQDRLLGANVQVELPLAVTWYATGNNVLLGADTTRRCLHIRLESPEESPEERVEFRHPRLLEWIARERGRILPAALTLLRAYWVAGRPRQTLPGWGSFESWSDIVRQCIVWLGLPDPAETREDLRATADVEAEALSALVLGLEDLLAEPGLRGEATAGEILQALDKAPSAHPGLREALTELVPRLAPGELPTSRQLGYLLRKYQDRCVQGVSLRKTRTVKRVGGYWSAQRRQGAEGQAQSSTTQDSSER